MLVQFVCPRCDDLGSIGVWDEEKRKFVNKICDKCETKGYFEVELDDAGLPVHNQSE